MADNYISRIEGVGSLLKLKDLNLARNNLTSVGDALPANTALEVLNLSDNNIGSFKVGRRLVAAECCVLFHPLPHAVNGIGQLHRSTSNCNQTAASLQS